jgi:NAD(P)-dependent dehydrogenase (short-subunit alcohol dehydrogenase family)
VCALATFADLSIGVCQAVRFFREDNPANVGGHILNISSAGGFNANPAMAYYNASKFGTLLVLSPFATGPLMKSTALEGFSEALSKEIPSDWNIRVTM